MTILAAGSIALDSIETPAFKKENILGGACTYFSLAARFFVPVRVVSVIGEDFPRDYLRLLQEKGIDTRGVHQVKGKTFRWKGRYMEDMNVRETIAVELGTFENFSPLLPEAYRETEYVFLANGDPRTQKRVLDQVTRPRLVFCDTMNIWIDSQRDELFALLKRIDGLFVNDEEARMLSGEKNLIRAGKRILESGPGMVLKKGEHGSILFTAELIFALPAFPLEEIQDPTGAGDTFAGGMVGTIAAERKADTRSLKRAMAYGTVMAGFAVESFGADRFLKLTRKGIDKRFEDFFRFVSLR